MNKLTLGFSPCPNDCFIFDALIHNKIDTEGLHFDVVMEDVETLNQKAFNGLLDITKLSYHAYAYLTTTYVLLQAGSALGNNCGPLLITTQAQFEKLKNSISPAAGLAESTSLIMQYTPHIAAMEIAIPGKYTTANFLLNLAFPGAKKKKELVFSDIEDALVAGTVDAGLIIHENRFTYQQKGLVKIIDLGEYWETLTQAPIPLGGIGIKRSLPLLLRQAVNRVLRKSVEYAFEHPKSALAFIKEHAQEMDEAVMYKHIDLYVNSYSIDLGAEGRKAIQLLFDKATETATIPAVTEPLFSF